jgi:hypothetical protein
MSASSTEPGLDDLNREFLDAEAFTCNDMYYARLAEMIVIAAAPTTGELRDQLRDYFGRQASPDAAREHQQ